MFTKRTIILNSVENNLHKAVVSLEKSGTEIKGAVRLYNFKNEPSGVLTLGILSNGEVYKAGLTRVALNQYEFSSNVSKPIDEFTCALVNSFGGEIKPLLIGSSNGASSQSAEVRLASSLGVLQKKSMDAVKKILDENQIYVEDDAQDVIEEEMKKCDENCFLCPYKKAFYNEDEKLRAEDKKPENLQKIEEIPEKTEVFSQKTLQNEENLQNDFKEEPVKKDKKISFYDEIKEQLGLLFSRYEDAKDLEDIIPNSKFVKIDYDDDGQFYVVGLIYEDGEIKYICYGVPGVWAEECPPELNGLSQWLPLNENEPEGKGYWLSYQDAGNGENIKIEVV